MELPEAFEALAEGQAITRLAWGDPTLIVRRISPVRWDGNFESRGQNPIEDEDLRADDWYIVGAVN